MVLYKNQQITVVKKKKKKEGKTRANSEERNETGQKFHFHWTVLSSGHSDWRSENLSISEKVQSTGKSSPKIYTVFI